MTSLIELGGKGNVWQDITEALPRDEGSSRISVPTRFIRGNIGERKGETSEDEMNYRMKGRGPCDGSRGPRIGGDKNHI